MHVGQESALVNSTSYRLDVPVEIQPGRSDGTAALHRGSFGISLGFDEKTGALVVHGGFSMSETSVPATSVHAPQPEPDLKDIIHRWPRLACLWTWKYSGYQTMLLTNPTGWCDLFGVSGDALPDRVVPG